MFGRVYCPRMRGGTYILRAIKRFGIFGIRNVQSRADKFDSLLQEASLEMLGIKKRKRIAGLGREFCSLEQFRVNFMEVFWFIVVWFSGLAVGLGEKSNGRIFVIVMLCNQTLLVY